MYVRMYAFIYTCVRLCESECVEREIPEDLPTLPPGLFGSYGGAVWMNFVGMVDPFSASRFRTHTLCGSNST